MNNEDRELEMLNEIKRLRKIVRELSVRITDGRDYLLDKDLEQFNKFECLTKLGYDENGNEI